MTVQNVLAKFEKMIELNKCAPGNMYLKDVATGGAAKKKQSTKGDTSSYQSLVAKQIILKNAPSTLPYPNPERSLSNGTANTVPLDDDSSHQECFRDFRVRVTPPRVEKLRTAVQSSSTCSDLSPQLINKPLIPKSPTMTKSASRPRKASSSSDTLKEDVDSLTIKPLTSEEALPQTPVESLSSSKQKSKKVAAKKKKNEATEKARSKKEKRTRKINWSNKIECKTIESIPQYSCEDEMENSSSRKESFVGLSNKVVPSKDESDADGWNAFQKKSERIKKLPREVGFCDSEDEEDE